MISTNDWQSVFSGSDVLAVALQRLASLRVMDAGRRHGVVGSGGLGSARLGSRRLHSFDGKCASCGWMCCAVSLTRLTRISPTARCACVFGNGGGICG